MPDNDLAKLLGGFAADTLTAEEKQRLYAAALQDQQLFNALADEQVLKELLADPTVRRRLLQALHQASPAGIGGSLSWLDWFRRPANVALAGGLAAAALAVVLGTKVYQESLRQQAAQPAATQQTQPAATPLQAPRSSEPTTPPIIGAPAKDNATSERPVVSLSKDRPLHKTGRQEEPVAISGQQAQRVLEPAGEPSLPQTAQEAARTATGAPAPHGEVSKEVAASQTQTATAATPPSTSTPIVPPMGPPGDSALSSTAAPTVSARALFYGEARLAGSEEAAQPMTPLVQSTSPAGKVERKAEQPAAAREKAAGLILPIKPLGLRYSLVVRGADGRDREVATTAAIKHSRPIHLTVETNQDGYIQIWTAVASSPPGLLFPEQGSGQISSKMLAGQRRRIPLPEETGEITIRLARAPFDSLPGQDAAALARPSLHLLQETTTVGGTSGSEELATYIIAQNPSSAQLSVRIPVGTP